MSQTPLSLAGFQVILIGRFWVIAEDTGSLIKYGNPRHMLGVLKAIREQTGKAPGDTIEVVVWKDEAVKDLSMCLLQFEELMKKEGLLPFFEKLSRTHRKQYCGWI